MVGRSGTTISPLCSMALVHAMYTRADGWGVFCVGAHHVVDHVVGAAKRGRVVYPPILIRRGDGAAISAEEPSNSRELKMRKCCSSTWHKPNGLRRECEGYPPHSYIRRWELQEAETRPGISVSERNRPRTQHRQAQKLKLPHRYPCSRFPKGGR